MPFEPPSFGAPPESALCAQHPLLAATGICSRCGGYACALCANLGQDGKVYCEACFSRAPVLAERGDRFIANLVDQFVVFIPYFASVFLYRFLAEPRIKNENDRFLFLGVGFLGTLAVASYQLYLSAQSGQSIGKRMRGLRVVCTDGSPASLGRIFFLRNLIPGLLGAFCGIVSLVDSCLIFGDERRCLHDMIASTKVVKVDPQDAP